jgi:hypothetical protein
MVKGGKAPLGHSATALAARAAGPGAPGSGLAGRAHPRPSVGAQTSVAAASAQQIRELLCEGTQSRSQTDGRKQKTHCIHATLALGTAAHCVALPS